MRFVGYKDNDEICRQFEPKRKGINEQVIMLKVSFYWLNVYFVLLFFTRKISFLMNVQLFP